MIIRRIYISFICLIHVGIVQAQNKPGIAPIEEILKPVYQTNWLLLKENSDISTARFISDYGSALLLNNVNKLQLLSQEKDAYGLIHHRYKRMHKGFEIFGEQVIFHSKQDKLFALNGNLRLHIEGNAAVNLSFSQALQRAKLFYPAPKYAWENNEREQEKKEMMHNPKATYYPASNLVWQKKGNGQNTYHLCYQLDMVKEDLEAKRVFVSAVNGEIINSYPLSTSCVSTAANTIFYGVRTIRTFQLLIPFTDPRYYLWDDCSNAYIRVRKLSAGDSTDYISNNNNWDNAISAATSLWSVKESYLYFLNVHGRQSWDNANAGTNVYQLPGTYNAYSSSGNLKFGEGSATNNFDDYGTLDIAAHEYAHSVTRTTADLAYSKESGALNESFSDIFGVACYQNFFGYNSNIFKIGYDRKYYANGTTSIFIRNMADPNSGDAWGQGNQPAAIGGLHWVNTTGTDPGDNWGVHINSGVQNYMYYMLVMGKSGTNEFGHAYSVSSIGFIDARRIAYQALSHYLSPNSTHTDARNAWVRAARDIFGDCSNQAIQTGKAWDAVGLAPPDYSYNYVGNYSNTATFNVRGTANLANPSAMTIQPGANITVAAKKIVMFPGFKALSGSYFRARFGDCFYSEF